MQIFRGEIFLLRIFVALLGFVLYANAKFRFTNIECNAVDNKFVYFKECFLKAYNRSYQFLSINAMLLQKPVTNCVVKFALLKRESGYKPFLYNVTFDGCQHRRFNPVAKYFLNLFQNYSNLNHPCPYNHDIIVDRLDTNFLNYRTTAVLPMPRGQYCLRSDWWIGKKHRTTIKVFAELS